MQILQNKKMDPFNRIQLLLMPVQKVGNYYYSL